MALSAQIIGKIFNLVSKVQASAYSNLHEDKYTGLISHLVIVISNYLLPKGV